MALPSESPRPFWEHTYVRIAAGVVLVLLIVFGVRSYLHYRDAKVDKAIEEYLYNQMLPGAVMEIGRRCLLPDRNLKGSVHVITEPGTLRFTKLTPTKIPDAWSEANRICILQGFERFSRTPSELTIPGGREYEMADLEITFPPAQERE